MSDIQHPPKILTREDALAGCGLDSPLTVVGVRVTADDLLAAHRHFAKEQLPGCVMCLWSPLLIIALILVLSGGISKLPGEVATGGIAFLILFLACPLVVILVHRIRERPLRKYTPPPEGEGTTSFLVVAREGYASIGADGIFKTTWDKVKRVAITPTHLFLVTPSDGVILVAAHMFENDDEFRGFSALIVRYFEETNHHLVPTPVPEPSPGAEENRERLDAPVREVSSAASDQGTYELEYTRTREDEAAERRFNARLARRHATFFDRLGRWITWVFAVVVLCVYLSGLFFEKTRMGVLGLFVVVAVIGVVGKVRHDRSQRQQWEEAREEGRLLVRVGISPRFLHLSQERTSVDIDWLEIDILELNQDYLFVGPDENVNAIPRHAFVNDTAMSAFAEKARGYLIARRSSATS